MRLVLAALLGLLGVLAALSSGRQAVREYRAVAGLPRTAPGRPQRRADRLGHRPRLQPEPLRLSPEHHPQPGAVGAARASGTTAPWRPPRGRTPRIAASSPASGRSSSIPSGSSRSIRPDPTLAEYLASRGYQTAGFAANTNCCSYETGLDRGFAHFEDYPLTPRSLLSRTVPGKWILDERPESRRLVLRQEVDRPPIPRCARDQRRLPRLAGPPAARSSLLRLPELLRRPRAVHTPAGIRGPLRDPAQDPAGLPVPARLHGDGQEPRSDNGTS